MVYYGKGFAAVGGLAIGTTWGTAVELGAGDAFEYLSEGLSPDAQLVADEQVSGRITRLAGDKGNEFHSGDVKADMKYLGLERWIALAMGTAGTPTQVGATAAYKHVFALKTDKEGIFGSLAINKKVHVWEWPSVKVNGFSLEAKPGDQRVKMNFPLIPSSLNLNTTSGTNNRTTMAALTLPAYRSFPLFRQMQIMIGPKSGGALDSSNLVYVSGFMVSLDNKYPKDDVTTRYGYRIDEPISGEADMSGQLDFSKYWDETVGGNAWLLPYLFDKVELKMQVTFTGAAIGASAESLTLYFPSIQIDTPDGFTVGNKESIKGGFKFRVNGSVSAPTGMSYSEFTIELVNQNTVDALA